jgi:hypothetical protein
MNDTENKDIPRTAEQIARRSIVLHCIIAAAHGVSKPDISDWQQVGGLWAELSPRELQFMKQEGNSESEINWMTWLVEAQVALLWSIKKIDKLPSLNTQCNTGLLVEAMPGLFESTNSFTESAVHRDLKELQIYEEKLYNMRCDHAQTQKNNVISKDIKKEMAFFRHYGFSWNVGYCNQLWDEITPDT